MSKKQELNTAVRVTFKDGNVQEYLSLEDASKATGLSESAIKIRCNKSRQGSMNKKDKITCMWVDDYTFRSFQAKKSKSKGSRYELQIIKELTELGFYGLVTSRSESTRMDNSKVDIVDTENVMDCYIQCKATANTPNVEKITEECTRKERPLAIFWKKQKSSSKNPEFVLIPKEYFYKLITK